MKLRSVVFALTALGMSAGLASAQSELHVYMPQGAVGPVEKYIAQIMRDQHQIKLVITPALSGQALTKAVAQRANPEISVFMLDEGPWLQGKQAGLWDKFESVRNLQQIPERFRDADGQGSAFLLYLLGLIYDEKGLAERNIAPPTSYEDLWNPALKGQVTIPDANSTFSYALLFKINELEGGDIKSTFDPGFKKLRALSANVGVFHGGASTLIPLFSQGQALVGFNASFPAQRLAAEGRPIRWVAPKEGAIAIAAYAAVAKNAPAKDAAMKFVDLLLSPEYQALQAQMAYSGYVNPNTKLSEDFAKTFLIKPEVIEGASLMDWDIYLKNRSALNSRWQREVESK